MTNPHNGTSARTTEPAAREGTGDSQWLPRTAADLPEWRRHPGPVEYRKLVDLPNAGPDLMVALDIDGTVIDHDTSLTPAVKRAIDELIDTGTHVLLATGRSFHSTFPIARQLELPDQWMVSSNGAVIWSLDSTLEGGYEITDVETFDPEETVRTLHEAIPGAAFAVEDVGNGFRLSEPFPDGELTEPVQIVGLDDVISRPVARLTVRAPEVPWAEFYDIVEELGMKSVSYAVGWTSWLDVSPAGISKATALETVRKRLGIAPNATVAAGDGSNDVEMLAWASLGVAMGGARDEVRTHANADTGPVEDDGLVTVINQLLGPTPEP